MCFEKGEEQYDEAALAEKRTFVAYYDGGDVKEFCEYAIEAHHPDRIYVEMDAFTEDLREQLPECIKVTFSVTLIDWDTFQVYYVTNIQAMSRMVSGSNQVTFRGCPSGRMLEPFSQSFRVMNPKAVYLRQDPMGYHEKAFEIFVPFSLEDDEITIGEKEYLPFWLDAFDHPEHYSGKTLRFVMPLEIRKDDAGRPWSCGRVVMTCCMADLQFMSFELGAAPDAAAGCMLKEGWAVLDAKAAVSDCSGSKKVRLMPETIHHVKAPKELIMDSRCR